MKLKNPFKRLKEANRYDVADKFNKAAMLGVPVATGYYLMGVSGAINAAALSLVGYLTAKPPFYNRNLDAMSANIDSASIGMYDEDTEVGREVLRVKEEVGISEDIEIKVVNTNGQLSVASTSPIKIIVPMGMAHSMPSKEIAELIKHELAHVMNRDNNSFMRYGKAGFMSSAVNILYGGMQSIVSGPAPFVISVGAGLAQKVMLTLNRKNAEYRADAFAMKHGDPKLFLKGLTGIQLSGDSIAAAGVSKYRQRIEMLPRRLGEFLSSKRMPAPLMQWLSVLKPFFSGTHPNARARNEKVMAEIRKTEPDFQTEGNEAPSVLTVCAPCTGMEDPVDQYNATFYIRDIFEHVHGHSDVRVQFSDACESPQGMMIQFPMGMIVVMSEPPSGFDLDD